METDLSDLYNAAQMKISSRIKQVEEVYSTRTTVDSLVKERKSDHFSRVQPRVMNVLPLSCSKLPPMGLLPQPHTLLSSGILYCLGAHHGYILHLSDIFLMLWLVSNLVESMF